MQLKDKVAVITGAASGIGQAIALRFAREGAVVTVADIDEQGARDTVEKIRQAGGEASFMVVNVSAASQVEALIADTVATYGRLDVLVNNAGMEVYTTVAQTTEEEWDQMINVNLKGVFLGMKYALPVMIKQGRGSIVNMASVAGLAAWPGLGVYSASKGGVVLLTKAAAAEYGIAGIRVNAICPGSISTPLLEEQFFGAMEDPEGARAQLVNLYPLKRLGEVEEIAAVALFLAGGESSFITGQALAVDGGISSFVGDLVEGK